MHRRGRGGRQHNCKSRISSRERGRSEPFCDVQQENRILEGMRIVWMCFGAFDC